MKVAVRSMSPVAIRAARVLAADPDVTKVGLLSDSTHLVADFPRIPPTQLQDWDVLVTDTSLVGLDHPALVSASPVSPDDAPGSALIAANLDVGVALALTKLQLRRATSVTELTVAWTEPDVRVRRGEAIRFPEPVGIRLAEPTDGSPWEFPPTAQMLVASDAGQWAGVLIRMTERERRSSITRVIGIADSRVFLEPIALAAGVLAMGSGAISAGIHRPHEAPEAFVEAAVRSGLSVAAYSSES
jgi:hypothetical protein